MIVACVRTGEKYSSDYVVRLRAMVEKHLPMEHQFICLTDRPSDLVRFDIQTLNIAVLKLPIWWGKMALFDNLWRRGERVLYFDLDTVIVGDLSRLADLTVEFGICANFTRASGNLEWPCRYGSCVMTLGPSLGGEVFNRFWRDREALMVKAGKFGDQKVIEELAPSADLLQPILPPHFFLGYRELPNFIEAPPAGCACVIFAGRQKPHNCDNKWVKAAWRISQ